MKRLLCLLILSLPRLAAAQAAVPEYFNAAGFDWHAVVTPPLAEDSIAG